MPPKLRSLVGFLVAFCSLLEIALGFPNGPPTSVLDSETSYATSAPTAEPAANPSSADEFLSKALELERQRDWLSAIKLYQQALEEWPTESQFRHRLRLCETHEQLARRYRDRSFREELLRLSSAEVLSLADELYERIETAYVEPVQMDALLRNGYDHLEVALRDPVFHRTHGIDQSQQQNRIDWLRAAYQQRRNQLAKMSRRNAMKSIREACSLGRRTLGLPESAIALEFIYGACNALPDDYSGCLTPDRMAELYAEIDGNFVGIGVELKMGEGDRGLRIVDVIRGGPAFEAGLKPGEQIIVVDGESLEGKVLDEAAATLQGTEGSSMTIEVQDLQGAVRRLRLIRRPVEVLSVEDLALFQNDVGYLRLAAFQKTTVREVERGIARLEERGMDHLILDLRGNPGGLLVVAVDLADRFLNRGRIVSTKGRAPGQSFDYVASSRQQWRVPLTILVDHDSASASEILAGALQENGRATIIGDRSYGKGSVQSIYPLRTANAALKLTTARFYSPRNRAYSEQGVTPDIQVQSVARPSESVNRFEPLPIGDPERDQVLRVAIRHALRTLGSD